MVSLKTIIGATVVLLFIAGVLLIFNKNFLYGPAALVLCFALFKLDEFLFGNPQDKVEEAQDRAEESLGIGSMGGMGGIGGTGP